MNELTVRSQDVGIIIPPEETLSNASIAAKALQGVISTKKKPVIMNGEIYLEFEDLQLLGQFYGYAVRTGEAQFVEIDGVKGAKAHADLIEIRSGIVIGGAEAYCMRDEEKWNTRTKYEWQGTGKDARRVKVGEEIVPWFQLASMAQTRSGAKAFRNRLAWVVVLAGYKPTPAEEMTDSTVSEAVKERRTVDKSEHYCPAHNINFFKKGRMTGFSHPIEGTKEWCNEPEPVAVPQRSTQQGDNPPVVVNPQSGGDAGCGVDMDWLRECFQPIKWNDATCQSWIEASCKVKRAESLEGTIALLDKEQKAKLCDFVARARGK